MTANRPTYLLTLRPEWDGTDPDGIRRLRALLKAALRSYRLRCLDCRPIGDEGDKGTAGASDAERSETPQ